MVWKEEKLSGEKVWDLVAEMPVAGTNEAALHRPHMLFAHVQTDMIVALEQVVGS